MKKLLIQLREQHQKILNMLEDKSRVEELVHFVEKVHHPLEEDELFPEINKKNFAPQGGPRCTFFMGMRILMNPMERMKQNLDYFYRKANFQPTPYNLPEWLTPQNPLSVPFEEHVVGAAIAEGLLFLNARKGSDLYNEFFDLFYSDYSSLIKSHIDKEDNCLFIMCEQALY